MNYRDLKFTDEGSSRDVDNKRQNSRLEFKPSNEIKRIIDAEERKTAGETNGITSRSSEVNLEQGMGHVWKKALELITQSRELSTPHDSGYASPKLPDQVSLSRRSTREILSEAADRLELIQATIRNPSRLPSTIKRASSAFRRFTDSRQSGVANFRLLGLFGWGMYIKRRYSAKKRGMSNIGGNIKISTLRLRRRRKILSLSERLRERARGFSRGDRNRR